MRNFTTEDFNGSGQYLIRDYKPANQYIKPIFISNRMYKVGYTVNSDRIGTGEKICTLTLMSDGATKMGNFKNTKNEDGTDKDPSLWERVIWQDDEMGDGLGKQRLVDYLNDPELTQEIRFATQEEVVRAVMCQSSKWRNIN